MDRTSATIGVLVGLVLGLPTAPVSALAAPPASTAPAPAATARVLRVVDGDTVVLDLDGRPVRVRLIGVDAPESVHPSRPVERFGREAAAFLRALVQGKQVRLEYKPGPRLDRYGRTLPYLRLDPGGTSVNREIIARGYGFAYTRYPFRYMDEFRAAERAAREGRFGLWGPDPASEQASAEGVVHVTRTGTRYHREGRRYLAGGATALPLDRAAARYAPRAVCRPPAPPR